jgi:hypothetical protein
MMCSMVMFETLKLGIIDLQREPYYVIDAVKKLENILIAKATEIDSSENNVSKQNFYLYMKSRENCQYFC